MGDLYRKVLQNDIFEIDGAQFIKHFVGLVKESECIFFKTPGIIERLVSHEQNFILETSS